VAMKENHFDLCRMMFDLEVVDGWPPVSAETLWVQAIGPNKFQIDNCPFFVKGIAVRDLVEGHGGPEDVLRYSRKLESGGHSTIHVVVLDDEVRPALKAEIAGAGSQIEEGPWQSLFSIDVPDRKLLAEVHRYLNARAATGEIEFEDACIAG
jgi:Domain of unknown function (DUF4265)